MNKIKVKLLKVLIALEGGGELINQGTCAHWAGFYDNINFGPHNESSNIAFVDRNHEYWVIPCKNHLQYYVNAGPPWEKVDL